MNFITKILGIALLMLIPTQAEGKIWSLNEVLDATCRVNAGSAYGSGTAINKKNGYYYILTNAHVVGSSQSARVEFFKNGRKTLPIPGKVVFRRLSSKSVLDVAIIAVDAKYFGNHPPRIAVLGNRKEVAVGNYVQSAGCPSARWANSWEGFIVQQEGGRLIFYPPPIGGQSGSGLYIVANRNGVKQTVLKGVVTWRLGSGGRNNNTGFESARGGAVLIDRLYDAIEGKGNASFEEIPANWTPVSEVKIPVFAHKGTYVYADNGVYYPIKYYEDGSYTIVGVPRGTKVLAIGIQCPGCGPRYNSPGSQRPPRDDRHLLPIPPRDDPGPAPDSGRGPYDFLPDLDEEEIEPAPPIEPPKNDEELEELRKQNTDLKTELSEQNKKIAGLVEKLNAVEEEYTSVKDAMIAEKQVLSDEISQLRIDIVNQQTQVQNLVLTLDETEKVLSKALSDKNEMIEEKDGVIDEKDKVIEDKSNELKSQQDSVNALNEAIEQLLNKNQELEFVVEEQNEEAKEKDTLIENAKQKIQETSEQRNWFGWLSGGLGIGILGWFAKWYISTNPLRRIEDKLDPLQDKVQQAIEPIIGADTAATLRQRIEDMEQRLIDTVDKLTIEKIEEPAVTISPEPVEKTPDVVDKLEGKLKSLEDIFINAVDKLVAHKTESPTVVVHQVPQVETQEIDEDYEIDAGPEPEIGVLSTRDREDDVVEELKQVNRTMQQVVDNLAKSRKQHRPKKKRLLTETTTGSDDYAKQFFELKAQDGEKMRDWVLLAALYTEAVGELEKGRLYATNKNKLQGQKITAEKINDWVQKEFVKRNQEDLTLSLNSNIEQNALLGFLYKEAIDELKLGRINALGAVRTAQAIQRWVEKEYLRRTGSISL